MKKPLTIAWVSDFPLEWLPDLPTPLQTLPRQHPATWQRVLLAELEKNPSVRLHILALRKQFPHHFTFARNGVTFHCLKTVGGLRAPSFFWFDTLMINRTLRQIRPDLVHAWGTEKGAALVASRLKYPHVVTMHGLLAWLAELVPLNCYEHFVAALEQPSLRRLKKVTAESTFAVEYLRQRFPQLEVVQIEHAPNWIFHHVERRPQLNPIRLICIGQLGYGKGSDLLFKALDWLQDELAFELIFVGRPDSKKAHRLVSSLSVELRSRINFKENLSSREVADELAFATLMIHPTRADNSPNAVKEAVVAGVPVIASDIGGIPDYVFPGQNGFLFPPGDATACLTAIRTACHHPLISKGLVDRSTLEKTRDYLSPRKMGKGFWEVYQDAIQRHLG